MKRLQKILPDVLAVCGAVCIVVALWMISPWAGVLTLGVCCICGAVVLSFAGGGRR